MNQAATAPVPKGKSPDLLLLFPVVLLVALGMVMVYSASGVRSEQLYGDSSTIFMKQAVALVIGSLAGLGLTFLPPAIFRNRLIIYGSVLLVVLLLLGVKFQEAANGASRWYRIGTFGFQPSDLAKMVMIMVTAVFSTACGKNLGDWARRLGPIILVLTLFCALIMWQPDFGTTMIIVYIVGVMLFLSGIPYRILAVGGIVIVPVAIFLVMHSGYRLQRILDFRAEEKHYQNLHSEIAIGSGGITGVGLGQGKEKLFFLPEPHTDFIFSTIGEELGLVGTLSVFLGFLFFFLRGMTVLSRVEIPYMRIMGSGILILLVTQAFINVSITLSLFPNKGLPLPFISAGGTSLMLSLIMCGMLLNFSRFQTVKNRVKVD